jgi:hypothetical protein
VLVRLETTMLLVVVVIAAGGAYYYMESSAVKAQVRDLAEQYELAADDLVAMKAETARLTEALDQKSSEMASLQESSQSQEMTSVEATSLFNRQQAQDIGVRLIEFVAEADLELPPLDTIRVALEIGSLEVPAFNYSIVAAGPSNPLLEMLALVEETRAAKIDTLKLKCDPEDANKWVMTLNVNVVFAEEG